VLAYDEKWRKMLVKQILEDLNLGSSVAEFDEALDRYFVDTNTFHALTLEKKDIIAGDKGTGKTALYRTLIKRRHLIPQLQNTDILTGFNIAGDPIFQQLLSIPAQTEGQYLAFWKTYFLALMGNWLTSQELPVYNPIVRRLGPFLDRYSLRSADNSAQGVFTRIVNFFPKLPRPKSFEAELAMTEAGMPSIKPKIEFGQQASSVVQPPNFFGVDFNAGLVMLNGALRESGRVVWITLDRLDEAFLGFPSVELPALRALLRTYLDFQSLHHIKLKLFVRKDLFRKVIAGGFVNLTHINSRKIEIIWDEEDLKSLLVARIKDSPSVVSALSLKGMNNELSIYKIFPSKIAQGKKQSTTWSWVMSRIRDGNGIKAPRNLIDFLEHGRESQLRSESRTERELASDVSIIEADSVKKALHALSQTRVQDTLLAESTELVPLIEKFRGGKAEHNTKSLSILLGVEESEVRSVIKPLEEIGLLEEIGNSFKVPMLYRDGLEITQGKAFANIATALQTNPSDDV
jgi:hypothetical protein